MRLLKYQLINIWMKHWKWQRQRIVVFVYWFLVCLLAHSHIAFPKRIRIGFDAVVIMCDRNEAHIFISSERTCLYVVRILRVFATHLMHTRTWKIDEKWCDILSTRRPAIQNDATLDHPLEARQFILRRMCLYWTFQSLSLSPILWWL